MEPDFQNVNYKNRHELLEILSTGTLPAVLATQEWIKIRKIVIQKHIETFHNRDFVNWDCPLCAEYDNCLDCTLPRVGSKLECGQKTSPYAKVVKAKNHADLVSALDGMVSELRKAAEYERGHNNGRQ